jgi:glycosyltransferase involved in cell wall biosynthesis
MKILHLSTYDTHGGAARATHRIHTALRQAGIDSSMMTAEKWGRDPTVLRFPVRFSGTKRRWAEKILCLQHASKQVLRSMNIFPSGLHQQVNQSDADLVHLHWIHDEMISISEIARISKPIVWTLHDMWAFCGTEHYEELNNPGRYIQGYTKDNRPENHGGPDIDAWAWHRKKHCLKPLNIHFVTPSRWLAACVKNSALFSGHRVTTIGNCLDTDVFSPVDCRLARKLLGLPADRKLLLFGAAFSIGNMRKGYDLLHETLERLAGWSHKGDCEAVVFGDNQVSAGNLPLKTHFVGRIKHDALMALFYSAADVFVAPSRQDNLPNTVLEALACGLPCVAFRVGGLGDLVDHRQNGYLAKPFDTGELARGIQWLLEDEERLVRFGTAARNKVENSFSRSRIASQHIRLYKKVLAGNGGYQVNEGAAAG